MREEILENLYRITEEEGRKKLNTTVYSLISGLDSSAQGADIEGNFLYVSSSFKGSAVGVKSSFITKYDISLIDATTIDSVDRDEYFIIKDNGHGVGSICCLE